MPSFPSKLKARRAGSLVSALEIKPIPLLSIAQ
jgi:hypothetical protein